MSTASPSAAAVLVRDAHQDEFVAAGELTLRAYEHASILGTDPAYRLDLLNAAARAAAGRLWVAVQSDDALLGTVTYCPHGTPYAEISTADEAEFRMLAVDPAAQGRGVAAALVERCVREAKAAGLARLVLSVIDHNQQAAAMYDHMGFTRAPERDWEPVDGVLLRVWSMAL